MVDMNTFVFNYQYIVMQKIEKTGHEVKIFICSTHTSMKLVLVLNFKMPTIRDMKKDIVYCSCNKKKCLIFFYLDIYEEYRFHAHVIGA